jgi:hypothetical protein
MHNDGENVFNISYSDYTTPNANMQTKQSFIKVSHSSKKRLGSP